MTNKVTVTGAIVGTGNITLFLASGESMVFKQEDYRTAEIMEKISIPLGRMEQPEIELTDYAVVKEVQALVGDKMQVSEDVDSGELTVSVKGVDIPLEPLKPHLERARTDGSKGFQKFLEKFAGIKRAYTRDELLKFLKDADLPFMDDGSILGFKILGEDEANTGYMVDHHTKQVRQRLGSLVFMPESKVDQSRALCSTGLHIASRRYLRSFWNNNSRLCLVKIQPKDVVSVPQYETSKMRVSAYHIVKVFSKDDGLTIVSGTAIHDLPEALRMLSEAVAGDHGEILETVEVTGMGKITVTPVASKPERVERKRKTIKEVSRLVLAQLKAAVRIPPKDVRTLNKLVRARPHLADQDPKYLKKLVKAQQLFDQGASLRSIAEKLSIDRDKMSANLIKKAA